MSSIILFNLNNETFGFELKYVKEILECEDIKPVPLTPPFITGILNRRGKFLTIINVALLLGISSEQIGQDSKIISLSHNEMDIGLLVDNVIGIKSLDLTDKEQTLDRVINGEEKEERGFNKMVIKNLGNKAKVIILDLESIFSFLRNYKFKKV
jgi:purine-binding chemotaxis protein CheW